MSSDPTEPPTVLDEAQATRALSRTQRRLRGSSEALITQLRIALGIAAAPAVIDADFITAVAAWQVTNGLTEDGILGPDTAATLFQPLRDSGNDAESRELASRVRRARLASGPTYSPNGTVAWAAGVPFNLATFNLRARFEHDPDNGVFTSCGEVRQLIKWDATAAASMNTKRGVGVPHTGFPSTTAANTWLEDRGNGDWFRFGHRTGTHGTVQTFSRFHTAAGVTNMAHGGTYEAQDQPGFWPDQRGQYKFLLKAVDVCNGGQQIGSTDHITINW